MNNAINYRCVAAVCCFALSFCLGHCCCSAQTASEKLCQGSSPLADSIAVSRKMKMSVTVSCLSGTLTIIPVSSYKKVDIIIFDRNQKMVFNEMADLSEGEVSFDLLLSDGIYKILIFDSDSLFESDLRVISPGYKEILLSQGAQFQ